MKFRHCLLILSLWLFVARSFSQITVKPAITHVSCNGSANGSVELSPTGSGTPYTYTWVPGATSTNSITNKGAGTYSVTVKNTSAGTITATYNIGYKTKWHNFYSGMATNLSGDILEHTNDGVGGWIKGADGANKIPASTDGWIEYVTTNSDPKIFGLLDALSISGDDGIDFGLGLNSGSIYTENNGYEILIDYYLVGDILRIERVGNAINYKKNGSVIWTTTITTAMVQSDLTIRAALYNPNTALEYLGCSVPATPDVNAGPLQAIICSSSSVTLNGSSATSGVTYSWSPGGSSPTNSVTAVSSTGIYTLQVTDPANGCTSTSTVSVIEMPCIPYYFVLKKTLDAGYYNSDRNKIYFAFEEEYYDPAQGTANSLSYTIVTDKNVPVSAAPGLVEFIGDNRYSIDLSTVSGITPGGFYRIAITNKKNEVFYATFKY